MKGRMLRVNFLIVDIFQVTGGTGVIQLNYRDAMPLCEQLKESIRKMIVTNAYHTGEQLPPVRQLASKLTINPRTLEQAYMELEQEGYLYTIPGKGTYVAAQECVDSTRKSELMQKFDRLVIELSGLSVPAGELTRRVTDLTKET